jgi:hypothetical protein
MTSWCGQDKLYLFTLVLNTLKKGGSKEINTKGRKKDTWKRSIKIGEEGNKEGKIRKERSRK